MDVAADEEITSSAGKVTMLSCNPKHHERQRMMRVVCTLPLSVTLVATLQARMNVRSFIRSGNPAHVAKLHVPTEVHVASVTCEMLQVTCLATYRNMISSDIRR